MRIKLGNTASHKTSLKKHVLRFVLLLVFVLAGTCIWLINDTEFSKRLLEKRLTELTHRSFTIEGDFDFKLGRDLKVTAGGIKWASAAWTESANMLEVGHAVVVVDLWSLVKPPVVLRDVTIENATLDFDWNKEKQFNWYLGDRSKPRKQRLESLPLLLDKANIKDLNLIFRHPDLTDDLTIKVAQAQHQSNSNDDLVVNIEAITGDNSLILTGNIGPFPKLIVAGAVEFDLTAKGDDSSLSMKGATPRLSKLDFTHLQAGLQSTEIAKLMEMLKLPVTTHGPADLHLDYQTTDGRVDGNVKGNVGEFDLDLVMHANNMHDWQGIVLNATSSGPSALAAGKLLGLKMLPSEPYQLDIQVHDSGQGLLIDAAHFTTAGAVVTASGSVNDFPKLAGIKLDFDASAVSIKPFVSVWTDNELPDMPLVVKGDIDRGNAAGTDRLDLTIKLGDMNASFKGALSEKPDFNGSAFQYTLDIPDSIILNKLLNIPVRHSVPINLNGNLKIGDAGPVLTATSGQIGNNQLLVSGDVPLRKLKSGVSSPIKLSGPNAAKAVGLLSDIDKFPTSAFQLSGNMGYSGRTISFRPVHINLGDNKFEFNGSLGLQSGHPSGSLTFSAEGPDLHILVDAFGYEAAPAKPFSSTGLLELTDKSIEVSNLAFQIGSSQVKGKISSGWPDQPESFDFDVSASGLNLQEFLPDIPQYEPEKVAFDIQAKGKVAEKVIAIESADVQLGSAKFKLQGQVGKALEWSANQLKLTGSGDHLTDLGTIYGWQFSDSAFNLSATMTGSQKALSVNDLSLKVGVNDLQGKLQLNMQDKPELIADLHSTHLDLRVTLAKFEDAKKRRESTDNKTDSDGTDEKDLLISAQPMPFDKLNSLNGSFTINIGTLLTDRLDLTEAQLHGTLKNGLLLVPAFSAGSASSAGRGGSGGLDGKLQIKADAERSQVEIWLKAENLTVIQEALDKYVKKNNSGQKIDLHLSGQGNSLKDLAATLDGYVWFRGGERQIEAEMLNVLYGDLLTQVLTTVLPFGKSGKYQTLVCDRIFFEAKKGMLETAPSIFFRTEKLDIEAIGLINLSTEEIDFNIQSTPRQGLGVSTGDIVNSFFRFQGTLAKPRLRLDPTGTLVEGGAAFATAGLSLVAKSLYKRWLKKELSCDEITEEARKLRAAVNPQEVPAD